MTDGAGCDHDGVLRHLICKVHIVPMASPAVIVARGHTLLGPQVSCRVATELWTFEEAVDRLPPIIQQFDEDTRHHVPAIMALPARFDFTFIGYSHERSQFEHWFMPGHADYPEESGVRAWEFNYCPDAIYASPFPVGSDFECPEPEKFEAETHGVRLMAGQRMLGGIGGFLQLTTLTIDSVSSRIVHRWPDTIGESICANPLLRERRTHRNAAQVERTRHALAHRKR